MNQHFAPIAVIAIFSILLAIPLTPPDPVSLWLWALPTILISVSAYLFGFRRGNRRPENAAADK